MVKIGKAVSHGAVTIVNAIACGFGAALGVDLWTEASVRLNNDPKSIEGMIVSDPTENTVLIKKTVTRVLKELDIEDEYGAYVETRSNIPIARGLKSSSSAANAIVLATLSALDVEIEDLKAINLGIDAAIQAKVTVTGAFDDACAAYFGSIAVTNNSKREILRKFVPKGDYRVLIYVPSRKAYTVNSKVDKMRLMSREVEIIHREALSGRYWIAMTLNGMVHSNVLGYDASIAIEALSAGAIAAGLSGTGPSVAAVVSEEKMEEVDDAWKHHEGTVIRTKINRIKAHVLK